MRAASRRVVPGGCSPATSLPRSWSGPQQRALQTCQLAGFDAAARYSELLVEWDYGDYEGLTDEQTQARAPGWDLFRDGCPGGESPGQVRIRVDELGKRIAELPGRCLLVGHGKALRAFAARWLQREIAFGSSLAMDPAAICVLEREHDQPLARLWNLAPDQLAVPSNAQLPALTRSD